MKILEGTGVLYVRAMPGFSLDQLYNAARDIRSGRYPGMSIDMPLVNDLRDVRLGKLPTAEFGNYAMRRRALDDVPKAGPVLSLVADRGTFGMMRMYSIISDLNGLRKEGEHLVTDDVKEGADWLAGRAGPPDVHAERILSAVEAARDSA